MNAVTSKRHRSSFIPIIAITAFLGLLSDPAVGQSILRISAKDFSGEIGGCIKDAKKEEISFLQPDKAFPLQSVMKLIVSAVVFDLHDQGKIDIKAKMTLTPDDISPGPRTLATKIIASRTLDLSVEDLIRNSVIESDSTSIDVLLKRIGGPKAVKDFLTKHDLKGIHIDRNERDLQAESAGLKWIPKFTDLDLFEKHISTLPVAVQKDAYTKYLSDQRDTSTPRAMIRFLDLLANGRLLSQQSTKHLVSIAAETITGKDRLPFATPSNWRLSHKTGTGRKFQGFTSAINDVGIFYAPNKNIYLAAVFIKNSSADSTSVSKVFSSFVQEILKKENP